VTVGCCVGVLLYTPFEERIHGIQIWRGEVRRVNPAARSVSLLPTLVNDSKSILKCILSHKQKACSCAPSTTGAAYAASGA